MYNPYDNALDEKILSDGFKLELSDSAYIMVRLHDSPEWNREYLIQMESQGYNDQDSDKISLAKHDKARFTAYISDWKGITFDGKKEAECTPDNIYKFMSDPVLCMESKKVINAAINNQNFKEKRKEKVIKN